MGSGAEFTPTRDPTNAFPLAQIGRGGALGDVVANLTWADRGEVAMEGEGRDFIGAEAHTNNTGELTAMYKALQRAERRPTIAHVVHSDSLYTIHMTTGHWAPRCGRNKAIVQSLRRKYRSLQRQGAGIHLTHVRSHTRVVGNELADYLADTGVEHEGWRLVRESGGFGRG